MKATFDFYKNLPKHSLSLDELLKQESLFNPVPSDWHVLVTDVQDSSVAVSKGFHHDVNICAVGSIISVLNELKTIDKKINIPYFFGGDGATFLVPNALAERLLKVLHNYKVHVANVLKLTLRTGSMKLGTIYAKDTSLRIAKLKQNKFMTIPVVLGNGLKLAEKNIKDRFKSSTNQKDIATPVNLDGMECRWNEIEPDIPDKKIVCLLVFCTCEKNQAEVYHSIIKQINLLFGDLETRRPIQAKALRLDNSISKIRQEMYARIGKFDSKYLAKNWLITLLGNYYFKYFKGGKAYVKRVIQLSDTIMLDGAINTIMAGNELQVEELIKFLNTIESEGKIVYGIHSTYASIMSCYVQDRFKKHIHFVDGTEGGYTTAAKKIKQKLELLD